MLGVINESVIMRLITENTENGTEEKWKQQ